MSTAGCKHGIVSCFSELCWVLAFRWFFSFLFSPPWLSPEEFFFPSCPGACWLCLAGSPVPALGASLVCLPVSVGPYLCWRGSVPLYVTRSGLAPPAVWEPSDYSEQQEKEVLQRALGQVRFSCTVFNYVCNRCVTITSRSQLFVTALELFARAKKGCEALWYL